MGPTPAARVKPLPGARRPCDKRCMTAPVPLDRHLFGRGQHCFGCSPDHPIGFRLDFAQEGDEVVTRFTPGHDFEGPPGLMHGGLVTTLADELAVWTVLGQKGVMTFTGAIQARLEARGRIVADTKRVIQVAVTATQEGEACFRGKFTLALLDEKAAERVLGAPLPDAWRRFAR
jgi:acyl-coenzyme A thioesterase PaaI-like protein